MTPAQFAAQALLAWLGTELEASHDVAKDGLPKIDVRYFFKGLSQLAGFDPKQYSIALVEFGHTETDLAALAQSSGLKELRAISDDLHAAADWRNKRKQFGYVLALAYGRHPGVHTLRHFSCPSSHDLASALLIWASESELFAKNPPQKQLLLELANNERLSPICSLEGVTRFLTAWEKGTKEDELDAPRLALTELGILYDPQLFVDGQIAHRLIRNIDVREQIREMPGSKLRDRRRRIDRYPSQTQRSELLLLLDKLEAFRLGDTNDSSQLITFDEVQKLIALPDPDAPEGDSAAAEDNDNDDDSGTEGPKQLRDRSISALLDGNDEALTTLSDSIESAWQEFDPTQEEEVTGEYALEGERHVFSFPLDASFLRWLEYFCTAETWGGLLESNAPTLRIALATYEDADSILISPESILSKDGQDLSIERLCADWDSGLDEEGFKDLQIEKTWRQFRQARMRLAPHIRMLVFNPLEWLPGRAQVLADIEEYLGLAAALYEKVQKHYRIMAGVSEGWARALLEALLSLDILQVRIRQSAKIVANKAVMLPLHPLHLWRYQRLAQVLKGLGATITDADRKAILQDVRRPEHFLSVILLGTIPAGRGANQILPVSNELHGLATFENLVNAYTGLDGAETLIYAMARYASLARHHARPLRVAIINPPEPDRLMSEVVRFLNSATFRQPASLPSLRIELFATPQHSGRIEAAMRLEDSVRDLVQEKLSSGRLQLLIKEQSMELPELIKLLERQPCHIAAIFDEASIRIRRRTAGRMLPMSPFCVRQQIRFEKFEDLIRLEPTMDEPPFSEFMQLVNEADNSQRDSTPHAWADAEALRETIDRFVQPEMPPAQWIFIADRALPSEGGLQSVRLLQRRDGQRQVLLAARDYRRIAELLRPAFDKCNLVLSPNEMEALLDEGVNLIGAGLLELVQTRDGRADPKKVLGLTGTLLAARHVRTTRPDAIIVSVDQELARLWLRIGSATNLDRSDLIAVRFDGECFQVEALEVKTTADADIGSAVIAHAVEQIVSTLAAFSEAIPTDASGTVLSAPRNEMLKEVLVRGCQGRGVTPDVRRTWGNWLKLFFRQDVASSYPQVRLSGRIVKVLMSSNESVASVKSADDPYSIFIDTLSEGDIQQLIQSKAMQPSVGLSPKQSLDSSRPDSTANRANSGSSTTSTVEATEKPHDETPRVAMNSVQTRSGANRFTAGSYGIVPSREPEPFGSDIESTDANAPTETVAWPPSVNTFGMIGQEEAVRALDDQAHFAKTFKEKFTDKLLVGPAGVGKSSLARGIARMLLNEQEIFFNGSDLREPTFIIDMLRKQGKLPAGRGHQTIVIEKCLIFVDEVHAIGRNVETALLSAMDDARITSIDQKTYDFKNVIFVLATTDPGKLSEAFNSRPDKTWLPPYTLEELAGIVWHHGKECLDGYELPKEVCLEVAARMRCNPRRAVRSVKEALRPHFLRKLQDETGKAPSLREIGAAMTVPDVAAYYDVQRIDPNGLDDTSINVLRYLQQNGATSEQRLRKALGISNESDFDELDEYLVRLQLIDIGSSGRALTKAGKKYITAGPIPLRHLISRQRAI